MSSGQRWLAALSPCLLVASTAFTYWATSGLETPLFLACVTFALWLDVQGRHSVALGVAMLATLTRPEGALLAAVLLAFWVRRTEWKRPRSWLLPALYVLFL